MPSPLTPDKPYLVQFTDKNSGEWHTDGGDFTTEATAVSYASHLLGQGKASVHVIKVVHYDAKNP